MHDVAVIGGGPAGCFAASLLAEKGFDVHVLEEHGAIGEPVDCSGVIGAESFDSLALPEALKLAEISSLTMVSPSGLEIPFIPSSPLAYVVSRANFDRAVAARATASGAAIHLGARVTNLYVRDDCVELEVVRETSTVRRPSGEEGGAIDDLRFTNNGSLGRTINDLSLTIRPGHERMCARVVILAGGPRYAFQEKLGMGRPSGFLKTAQTEVGVRGIEQARVLLGSQMAPGSFAWIVPFQRGDRKMARIGVSSKTPARPYLEKFLGRLQRDGCLKSSETAVRSWVIPVTPLSKTYATRVLAVGDAAGQTKPTTGGGIYYGLLCAEAAAETISMAFAKGDFEARILSRYEASWRKVLGREMRIGAFFRRLVERLRDGEIDDLFRVVQSDGILSAVARKARFDYHKDVIFFALRHPQLGRIFLRGLFR